MAEAQLALVWINAVQTIEELLYGGNFGFVFIKIFERKTNL